ncbi:MAG: M14-type cytosolic carboxypeptidase [Myxococcota bacterium]
MSSSTPPLHVGCTFESGNIEVVRCENPSDVELQIRKDVGEDHFQWFHFRATGTRDRELVFRITNAGQASYPDGWKDYRVCVSYGQEEAWTRLPADYDGNVLSFRCRPDVDLVHFAYFAPYPSRRHQALLGYAIDEPSVRYERLGATVDGRDLDLLHVTDREGSRDGRLQCWIIGRQHPGESMAEWLMEGLIEHLLDPDEPTSRALLKRCAFHLVPNMNPDGSFRGHLRNNAAGQNLNRAWAEPSLERSPEVFLVRRAMERTGVDFFLDVHGDEALPYNFIAGADGIPSWSPAHGVRQASYKELLQTINPDFQTKHGYPVAKPGKANLSMATNWVAERFKCLAMTLEQPFKDTADTPHPDGWSPERAKKLGRDQLLTLYAMLDRLR